MGDNAWVWWVLAAVVLLAIAFGVWRARTRAAAREEAGRLRARAAAGEPTIGGHEDTARGTRAVAEQARQEAEDLQRQADHARDHAETLEARAEEATRTAREARDDQTEHLLHADEVDPDTRR